MTTADKIDHVATNWATCARRAGSWASRFKEMYETGGEIGRSRGKG